MIFRNRRQRFEGEQDNFLLNWFIVFGRQNEKQQVSLNKKLATIFCLLGKNDDSYLTKCADCFLK